MKKTAFFLSAALLFGSCCASSGGGSVGLTRIPTFTDLLADQESRGIVLDNGESIEGIALMNAMDAPTFLTGFTENTDYEYGDSFEITLFNETVTINIEEKNQRPLFSALLSDKESGFELEFTSESTFSFRLKMLADWIVRGEFMFMYIESYIPEGQITETGFTGHGVSNKYYIFEDEVDMNRGCMMTRILYTAYADQNYSGVLSWWAAMTFEDETIADYRDYDMRPTMENMNGLFEAFDWKDLMAKELLELPSSMTWSFLVQQENGVWSTADNAIHATEDLVLPLWIEKTGENVLVNDLMDLF